MIKKTIFQLTSALVVMGLLSCNGNNKDMQLNFSSAIGSYKSNYRKGSELIRLKPDSIFTYELIISQDERYLDTGRWSFSEPKNKITFYDWYDRIFMGYNSKEDYIASQKKMFGISINPDEVPRKEIHDMEFLIATKSLKKVYVLRRNYDQQEEYDFVKQE